MRASQATHTQSTRNTGDNRGKTNGNSGWLKNRVRRITLLALLVGLFTAHQFVGGSPTTGWSPGWNQHAAMNQGESALQRADWLKDILDIIDDIIDSIDSDSDGGGDGGGEGGN